MIFTSWIVVSINLSDLNVSRLLLICPFNCFKQAHEYMQVLYWVVLICSDMFPDLGKNSIQRDEDGCFYHFTSTIVASNNRGKTEPGQEQHYPIHHGFRAWSKNFFKYCSWKCSEVACNLFKTVIINQKRTNDSTLRWGFSVTGPSAEQSSLPKKSKFILLGVHWLYFSGWSPIF